MELVMVMLLAYQIFMPATNNGNYQIAVSGENVIRINTQTGKIEKCDIKTLTCNDNKEK